MRKVCHYLWIGSNKTRPCRCCTATVKRALFEEQTNNQDENSNSLAEQLQSTRKRSLSELASIISLLKQKERRSTSKHVRAELHRTRQRLEKYGKIRYGDLIDNDDSNTQQQPNNEEREMYDMLEKIIRKLVQQHQNDQLDESTVEKRSVDNVEARRAAEDRLSALFKLWVSASWQLFIVIAISRPYVPPTFSQLALHTCTTAFAFRLHGFLLI